MEHIISIGIISAIAAGFACYIAHPIARRLRLGFVPRYGAGVVIGLVAYAFPLFGALPIEMAVLLFGMACLIFIAGEGFGTWLAHQARPDPPPNATPDADRVLSKLDEEIGK